MALSWYVPGALSARSRARHRHRRGPAQSMSPPSPPPHPPSLPPRPQIVPTGTLKHTQHVGAGQPHYATYLFMRSQLDIPFVALPGLEKPSVAVRACPCIFGARPAATGGAAKKPDAAAPATTSTAGSESEFPKRSLADTPHRSVFAVLTLDEVLIYDTHQTDPLLVAPARHYAALTDATWSADGSVLAVSSSDGYVTLLNLSEKDLGGPPLGPEALAAMLPKIQVKETKKAAATAAAATTAAAGAVVAAAAAAQSEGGAATPKAVAEAPVPVAATANGAAPAPAAASSDAPPAQQPTKKRRIAPMLISSSAPAAVPAAAPSETTAVAPSTASAAPAPVSVTKKRISPTLLVPGASPAAAAPTTVASTPNHSVAASTVVCPPSATDSLHGLGSPPLSAPANSANGGDAANGAADGKKQKKRIKPTLMTSQ